MNSFQQAKKKEKGGGIERKGEKGRKERREQRKKLFEEIIAKILPNFLENIIHPQTPQDKFKMIHKQTNHSKNNESQKGKAKIFKAAKGK